MLNGTGAVEAMRVNGRLFRVGVIYSAGDLIKEYGFFRLLSQIGQTVTEIQELHRPGHGHKTYPALLFQITLFARQYALNQIPPETPPEIPIPLPCEWS